VVDKNYVLGVLASPENAEEIYLTLNIKKGELKNDVEK
jgi:hypothetical protein